MPHLAGCVLLFVLSICAVLPIAGDLHRHQYARWTGSGQIGEAIALANANPGPDTIAFSIGGGPVVISVGTALPDITGATFLDGTTQPG